MGPGVLKVCVSPFLIKVAPRRVVAINKEVFEVKFGDLVIKLKPIVKPCYHKYHSRNTILCLT